MSITKGRGRYLIATEKKPQRCRSCNKVFSKGSKYNKCAFCMDNPNHYSLDELHESKKEVST